MKLDLQRRAFQNFEDGHRSSLCVALSAQEAFVLEIKKPHFLQALKRKNAGVNENVISDQV